MILSGTASPNKSSLFHKVVDQGKLPINRQSLNAACDIRNPKEIIIPSVIISLQLNPFFQQFGHLLIFPSLFTL